MSKTEKFREVAPLKDLPGNVRANVIIQPDEKRYDKTLCRVGCFVFDVPEARALRDCLTEVLP